MTTMRMDDGAQLAVRDEPGDGVCVLLLHDFQCDGAYWAPMLARLRELAPNARFVVPDLRGHGSSTIVDAPSRKRLVKDCKRICKELGVSNPLVVGHGLGADIALAFEDAGAVVAINPRMGRADEVPYTEDVPRPETMLGVSDADADAAFKVGLAAGKGLRRSKRDAPLLLAIADPDDMQALTGTEVLEFAADLYAMQLGSRHLPIEMPAAMAALVFTWMEEAL